MRRRREQVAPGIETYNPAPIPHTVHENAAQPFPRKVLFVFRPDSQMITTLRLQSVESPLSVVFKEEMRTINLPDYSIVHEKKGQLDPSKSLSDYQLGFQCEITLVPKGGSSGSKIRRKNSITGSKRRNIEIEEGNRIKKVNPLGLEQVKDLYKENLIEEKGILVTKRSKDSGGRILNENAELDEGIERLYRIEPNNPLQLMKQLLGHTVKTEEELVKSLKKALDQTQLRFHQRKESLKEICSEKINGFTAAQTKEYQDFINSKDINTNSLHAIPLWTSDLFYHIVNTRLLRKEDIEHYQLYMRYLEDALKLIPSKQQTVYRGFKDYRLPHHEPGQFVFWRTVNSTSKNKEAAKEFTNERGTFFTIHAKQAKDISLLSAYPEQDESLLAPFTCYKILSYQNEPGKCCEVEMVETPSPRSTNTIIWVADKIDPLLVIELEVRHGYSVLFVNSNEGAQQIMRKFPWLMKQDYINLLIVTNGKQQSIAKAELKTKSDIGSTIVQLAGILRDQCYCGKLQCEVSTADKEILEGRYKELYSERFKTQFFSEAQLKRSLLKLNKLQHKSRPDLCSKFCPTY